ncbi:FAD/NAD(P)-binding protein [Metallosphaera javensis (ex Hofmann et al. 2022)]|uniref:FAD/NAD(P)-binding protein n=1 Tax=Metallosphaera javensis (ex Hofmann et al. 2022) TaxID=99938 RepID=UPI001EDDBC1C|nr:FAD/NAD(P)-binding protein [Metallosphaera javensis (ex Hofmann et al. 2022)]
MILVIGAGIAGLVSAQREGAIVIEEQANFGGLYGTEEINELRIPALPPLIEREREILEIYPDADISEINLSIKVIDEEHLRAKICPICNSLPNWLFPSRKSLFVKNFPEILNYLARKVKIVRGYPVKITKGTLFTNRGVYDFNRLINTGSRQRINRSLGLNEKIDAIGCLVLQIVTGHEIGDWDVYINGKSGTIFTHILRYPGDKQYYIYSFYNRGKLPDVDRVILDLKRARLIESREDILSLRARYINECLLFGEKEKRRPEFLRECGRLGAWENMSLSDAIRSALEC